MVISPWPSPRARFTSPRSAFAYRRNPSAVRVPARTPTTSPSANPISMGARSLKFAGQGVRSTCGSQAEGADTPAADGATTGGAACRGRSLEGGGGVFTIASDGLACSSTDCAPVDRRRLAPLEITHAPTSTTATAADTSAAPSISRLAFICRANLSFRVCGARAPGAPPSPTLDRERPRRPSASRHRAQADRVLRPGGPGRRRRPDLPRR